MPRPLSSNHDIDTLVSDFTAKVSALVRQSALEQVVAALGGQAAPARRGPGRPKGSKNKPRAARPAKKGGKRTTEQVDAMAAKLLSYVKSTPGQRGEQIAKVFHTDVGTMRLPMQKLVAAKQVRTEGQRRGTTYFAGAKRGPKPGRKPGRKAGKRGAREAKAKRVAKPAPLARPKVAPPQAAGFKPVVAHVPAPVPSRQHAVVTPMPRAIVAPAMKPQPASGKKPRTQSWVPAPTKVNGTPEPVA